MEHKQNVFYVRKDKLSIIITCACLAIIILSIILLVRDAINNPVNICFNGIIAFLLIVLPLYFYFMSPTKVELTNEAIIIHKVIGCKTFRYSDIKNVLRFSGDSGLRLWGSGGFFGYIGLFSSKDIGRHYEYVGDFSEAFLIILVSGKKYVLSCVDSSYVISLLMTKINIRPL